MPQRALSGLVGRLGRVERPRWLVRVVVRAFARHYRVDLSDAARPLAAYTSFTDFFTRALRPEARPLPDDPQRVTSPADGTVARRDTVHADRLLQAKGIDYSVATLLGDAELAREFEAGPALTVYLSPRDYHRVHAPLPGTLRRRIHRPGHLFSVSEATVRQRPGIFSGNERVILVFDDPIAGTWALVLVGALIVGGIETVWEGTINPRPHEVVPDRRFPDAAVPVAPRVERGDEIGRFRAGPTVIALFTPGRVEIEDLAPGAPLNMGQGIGTHVDATSGGDPA